MCIIRNDIYYQSLQKSLSKKLLSVQKVSKYFTLSTEAAIQIISLNCCIFFNFLKFCIFALSYTVSAVKKQFTCVLNYSCLARGWIVPRQSLSLVPSLVCVIKGPCILWYASKCSVLQLNRKRCEMHLFCRTTLHSFHLPFKGNILVLSVTIEWL